MEKLTRIFAFASTISVFSCASIPVPEGQPGHRPRPLTPDEIAMAKKVFGDQINYRKIRIYSHSGETRKAFYGKIQMSPSHYSEDYSKENNFYLQSQFMHELTHIWQEQNGTNLIVSAIGEWLRHGGDYNKAYKYTITENSDFSRLGIEQQGKIIEDYWQELNRLASGYYNTEYICGEILRFETVLKPVFPEIKTPEACR